ncbi:acyl-CoA carboxylase subunit epsilon [Cellulomonas composti]|uniref:Acetyl-CoA carboxylase biotin carboxyl carrier protein subunit n=1 Tax=Cellulomonas composti TaxID=266130 RepID=A0A511JCD2_9CELL|nr:acyl-CoA carboxylase subunit epsilon [Cellulomonas composti]GEL95645.1 hypothetical protein CCO02nite_23030 [Cellulomonas composti]
MSDDAHVQVVRGAPDDVELAALVAGLIATAGAPSDEDAPVPAAWTDRPRRLGATHLPAPTTWRWSLHP